MHNRIPIFLSYPRPFNQKQEKFIFSLAGRLRSYGLEPRTLGVTDYDFEDPLLGIKELMHNCYGLCGIALRRIQVKSGVLKYPLADDRKENIFEEQWLTSPYVQIEPAMAFQVGLPILVLREQGVMVNGVLESKSNTWCQLEPVDVEKEPDAFLNDPQWQKCADNWLTAVQQNWAARTESIQPTEIKNNSIYP